MTSTREAYKAAYHALRLAIRHAQELATPYTYTIFDIPFQATAAPDASYFQLSGRPDIVNAVNLAYCGAH